MTQKLSIPEQQKQFKIAYRNWREQLRKEADRKRHAAKRKEKIENYWNFLTTRPYYVYEVDTKTQQPKEMLLMWYNTPHNAIWEWDHLDRQTSKYKVGMLTPEQGHRIIQDILRYLYGSKIPQRMGWLTPPEISYRHVDPERYVEAENAVGTAFLKRYPPRQVRMTRR